MITVTEQPRIDRVFALQRSNRLALKSSGPERRRARLRRLREEIIHRAEDIDLALYEDLRKPRMGASHFEIKSVLGEIDLAITQLDHWMALEMVTPSAHFAGSETYILYEPRGVVLLFGPWNFPFALTLGPLVSIVAAGNAAMVKPNELQPRTSRLIAEIIAEAFPEEEVACLEGGIALAEALQQLPFDHVFFTGSPAIGKRIMAAAARHLTSVTLELGGKCPAIIGDHYDLGEAAAKIVGARFTNAGQICLAVDHVWVPRARQEELLPKLVQAVERAFYVDGALQTERLSRMVDARNLARVKAYVDEAVGAGARLVSGGQIDENDLTIHPTILAEVPLDTRVMHEEIFGPVLPVIAYDDITEVASHIDVTGKPLALYIFSHDREFVDDVLVRTSSGGVTINNVLLHFMEGNLPFGGVNNSGMGRSKGIHGFRELSNARSIFAQAN